MILYHYTTANGLRKIIESKSIWASDFRFLNDATEFQHGLSIFKEIFASFSRSLTSEFVEIIDRQMTSEFCVLIASFCEEPDLLSQWRGYNGAAGYALGIDADWLNQNASEEGFQLVRACYDAGEQQQAVADKINLFDTVFVKNAGSRTPAELVKEWLPQMLLTIAALKNDHFKEEREYRLVKVTDGWPPRIQTRASVRGLVPYLPVNLNANPINSPLFHPRNCGFEHIVVGPALQDQQRVAVDALLASQHMRFKITKSAIPYVSDH